MPDEAFREEFKPLYVPAYYEAAHSDENKIIYALAQLGEGATEDVIAELAKHDPGIDKEKYKLIAASVLNNLYNKGLINGTTMQGNIQYNLSKITEENSGSVNPQLLAPGLD